MVSSTIQIENLAKAPIGILDSGIGGIAIARAIMQKLPNENYLYFGDTLHMPYGKKSADQVISYTRDIIEFFISRHSKAVVIACNTAFAASQELLNGYQDKIKIFNVIDPVLNYVIKNYQHRKIGLLCTDLTYNLGIFEKKIEDSGNDIRLISLKASQLASLIENDFSDKSKIEKLVNEYLVHHQFKDIEGLILGCTHYLWLKDYFLKLKPFLDWIEPSILLANEIETYLRNKNILNETVKQEASLFSNAVFCQSGGALPFFQLSQELTPSYFNKYYFTDVKI